MDDNNTLWMHIPRDGWMRLLGNSPSDQVSECNIMQRQRWWQITIRWRWATTKMEAIQRKGQLHLRCMQRRMHPNCDKKRELKSKSSRTTSCECAPLRGVLLLWPVGRSDLSHVLSLGAWIDGQGAVNLNKQRKPECHPGFIQNRSPVCKNICASINSESMNFFCFFLGLPLVNWMLKILGVDEWPFFHRSITACWHVGFA